MAYNQLSHQQTVVTHPGAPAIVSVAPVQTVIFHVNAVRNLGIAQIVFAILTMICGIIGIIDSPWFWFSASGTGIWTGVMILITGILCICAANKPETYGTRCAALTFSIICIFLAFIAGIMAYIGFITMITCSSTCYNYYDEDYNCYSSCQRSTATTITSICVSVLMTVEFILAIIVSVYTGRGCCGPSYSGVIVQQPYHPATQGTVITSNVTTSHAGHLPPYSQAPPNFQAPPISGQYTGYQSSAGNPHYQYSQAPMMTQTGAQPGVTYGTDYNQKSNFPDQAPPPPYA